MLRFTGDDQMVFSSAVNKPSKLRSNIMYDASHRDSASCSVLIDLDQHSLNGYPGTVDLDRATGSLQDQLYSCLDDNFFFPFFVDPSGIVPLFFVAAYQLIVADSHILIDADPQSVALDDGCLPVLIEFQHSILTFGVVYVMP